MFGEDARRAPEPYPAPVFAHEVSPGTGKDSHALPARTRPTGQRRRRHRGRRPSPLPILRQRRRAVPGPPRGGHAATALLPHAPLRIAQGDRLRRPQGAGAVRRPVQLPRPRRAAYRADRELRQDGHRPRRGRPGPGGHRRRRRGRFVARLGLVERPREPGRLVRAVRGGRERDRLVAVDADEQRQRPDAHRLRRQQPGRRRAVGPRGRRAGEEPGRQEVPPLRLQHRGVVPPRQASVRGQRERDLDQQRQPQARPKHHRPHRRQQGVALDRPDDRRLRDGRRRAGRPARRRQGRRAAAGRGSQRPRRRRREPLAGGPRQAVPGPPRAALRPRHRRRGLPRPGPLRGRPPMVGRPRRRRHEPRRGRGPGRAGRRGPAPRRLRTARRRRDPDDGRRRRGAHRDAAPGRRAHRRAQGQPAGGVPACRRRRRDAHPQAVRRRRRGQARRLRRQGGATCPAS